MEILKLKPAFKDYLWGGNKLQKQFFKSSSLDIVAESWEVSTNEDGLSLIADSPYKGMTLAEYIALKGPGVIGADYDRSEFPILIKLIDAAQSLSIQVHPDDTYALAHENSLGKTEMWYIIDAAEGAFIYYGVKKPVTRDELEEAIRSNTIEDLLEKRYVKKGDHVFLAPGTIHAIGAGILICEVQQNSNITYRVYDYDRRGADGAPRQLHIPQALAVSKLTPNTSEALTSENPYSPDLTRLAQSPYFNVFKGSASPSGHELLVLETSFQTLTFIEGFGSIEDNFGNITNFRKGDSFFIPAQEPCNYWIKGKGEFIMGTL